ncbi:hypothetical protein FIV04_25350 (plasmid) [Vibrio sp. THAF190c]|nr:hypothetical protein FIV04_25350 [Vibrio sp. THAF190c]
MSVNDLVKRLEELNSEYRKGNPLVTDGAYDLLIEE